ncbi:phytanoyl-CoA dioxygenase family protein [Paenibacillus sp. OV219]|uniref:phytanoyl-CoA dioxygenase family protein n=1 Tax=Paenibacillus sp. OV219 TaxID=1884377 RepID=UPI0008CFBAAD|nr:phytanoyl-CoA dioxygenase family protein [Paenibacillus sp. OV219]SEO63145.1 Ectoine hydroxylase-related dioxygenase, phytanoyl-CoA dioxygenase (PhyH) family [Paenibacillus sp. OV219]
METNLKDPYQLLDENGYVVLKGVLSEVETDSVLNVVAQVVDRKTEELFKQGLISDKYEELPVQTRWVKICEMYPQEDRQWNEEVFSEALYHLCSNPKLLDVVEHYVGSEINVNGDYWLRPKLPHEEKTTIPWHQDSFYYNGVQSGNLAYKILSIWIPLVAVDENNGCMQIITGSHKWGLLDYQDTGNQTRVPVEDVEQRGEVITVRMNKGDILLFNQLTLHRSLPNISDGVRWSIDLRYTPADQSFDWHSLSDAFFDKAHPCFVARSQDQGRVMGWEDWKAKKLAQA